METLSIFILCHNRPNDARQAIRSVLAQSDKNFTLTVSDNSSNDDVQRMIQKEFHDVHYVRRLPILPALEHFNRCINEVREGYFCLFHDDDIMGPDFVAELRGCINSHPGMVAYSCNARIESFGNLQPKPSFLSFGKTQTISAPRDLAARYFSRAQSGIAPFPAYIYNKAQIGELRFEPEGGKYADVTWLLSLSMKGPILWFNKPLMTYRIHASNDGATESRRDRLRFLAFIKKNRALLGNAILQDYRCSFIYKIAMKSPDPSHPIRQRIADAYVKHYRWARYMRLDTFQALARRMLTKCLAKS
jgi:glycosyltransferase involved in cell wall biosynthesis